VTQHEISDWVRSGVDGIEMEIDFLQKKNGNEQIQLAI